MHSHTHTHTHTMISQCIRTVVICQCMIWSCTHMHMCTSITHTYSVVMDPLLHVCLDQWIQAVATCTSCTHTKGVSLCLSLSLFLSLSCMWQIPPLTSQYMFWWRLQMRESCQCSGGSRNLERGVQRSRALALMWTEESQNYIQCILGPYLNPLNVRGIRPLIKACTRMRRIYIVPRVSVRPQSCVASSWVLNASLCYAARCGAARCSICDVLWTFETRRTASHHDVSSTLPAKGGCSCTPLTPPKSATEHWCLG